MKQHYLPECYLREFVNSNGRLHTLDTHLIKHGREVFGMERYPVEVCRSKHFYTIKPDYLRGYQNLQGLQPLYLEYQFQNYESKYPALIAKLKRGQSYLKIEEARLLIYVLFDLKIRNKYFRDTTISGMQEKIFDQVTDEIKAQIEQADLSEFPGLTKEKMLDAIAVERVRHMSDEEFAEKTHISSLTKRKTTHGQFHEFIIEHLLQFDWLILSSNHGFITTDNPGVSVDKSGRIQNTKFDKDFFFLMPLTHSLCIGISPKTNDKNYRPGATKKHLKYGKAQNDIVEIINTFHGYHLSQFIFASNKPLIDQIAEVINTKVKADHAKNHREGNNQT